jgi:hypothetical protein
MKAQTPQEAANEQTIRKLYSFANATTKDTRTSSISKPPTTKATCVGHAPGASKSFERSRGNDCNGSDRDGAGAVNGASPDRQ